jgi:hypothetical protein
MNNKIIVSKSNSRLLDNLKIAMYHHKNNVDVYVIDMKEIFKAYDIIQPYRICVSEHDFNSMEVKAFYTAATDKEKSIFIIDNDSLFHVVNTEIFRKYSMEKSNDIAILLDNINELPENILKLCDTRVVHMFNNPNIKHPMNLGTLLEHQKAFIFSSYKYIVGKNNIYKNESLLCGASYIDMDSGEVTSVHHDQNITDINEYIKKEFYGN